MQKREPRTAGERGASAWHPARSELRVAKKVSWFFNGRASSFESDFVAREFTAVVPPPPSLLRLPLSRPFALRKFDARGRNFGRTGSGRSIAPLDLASGATVTTAKLLAISRCVSGILLS